jgi:hypothetical protein
LISSNNKKDTTEAISRWNPFEDTNFSQEVTEVEEDLFGAEFDKIRQEGIFFYKNLKIISKNNFLNRNKVIRDGRTKSNDSS